MRVHPILFILLSERMGYFFLEEGDGMTGNTVKPKWVKLDEAHSSTYVSTHRVVAIGGRYHYKWKIVETNNKWVVYAFINSSYVTLKGLAPMNTLREAKYYCDVEVENFNKGIY